MEKKDYNGNELNIGDVVIFIRPNYREFVTGVAVAFTPKCVRVKYRNQRGDYVEILQFDYQLIKR